MSNPYPGSISHRDLDNGRVLVLYPMIYTYRLCLGWQGDEGYSRAWCYDPLMLDDAGHDLMFWNGEGDPPGRWQKEVGTERRRHYNAAGEEIGAPA